MHTKYTHTVPTILSDTVNSEIFEGVLEVVKNNTPRKITLSFTDVDKLCPSLEFLWSQIPLTQYKRTGH